MNRVRAFLAAHAHIAVALRADPPHFYGESQLFGSDHSQRPFQSPAFLPSSHGPRIITCWYSQTLPVPGRHDRRGSGNLDRHSNDPIGFLNAAFGDGNYSERLRMKIIAALTPKATSASLCFFFSTFSKMCRRSQSTDALVSL